MLTPLIFIALGAALVWALTYFIPMTPKAKQAIWAVAGVILLGYLRHAGLLTMAGVPEVIVDVVMMIAATGLLVWLVVLLIPMPAKFQVAVYAAAGVLLLLCLLSYFGVWSGFGHFGAHARRR